jgi:hypothetical protein
MRAWNAEVREHHRIGFQPAGGVMVPVNQAATEFLAKKRIAVTGVSRTPKDHGSNVVYKRLRDRCYHDLKSVPGGVEAVVIGTRPGTAAADYGRQRGITVIDGGCPLMFGPTADFGHKMMRLMFAGHVPKQV